MRDWGDVDDRRAATLAFATFMEKAENKELRQKCCDDPIEAKRQFAIVGEFYLEGETLPNQPPNDGGLKPIPSVVDFKVYDKDDQKRQSSVVLVLPSARGRPNPDPIDIWIAAWQPWKT